MQFKNETELLLDMVTFAQSKGLISTDDDLIQKVQDGSEHANQYILDLACHAHVLAQIEEEANLVYRDINVSTASGEALDNLGRLVGVTRFNAQAPVVDVTLSLEISPAEDITFKIDLIVWKRFASSFLASPLLATLK